VRAFPDKIRYLPTTNIWDCTPTQTKNVVTMSRLQQWKSFLARREWTAEATSVRQS
jgi:hypothetical protein